MLLTVFFYKYGLEAIYTFLHLTFQEFLAACHIAIVGEDEQKEIILKYGCDRNLAVVWKFYCGMITHYPITTANLERLMDICTKNKSTLLQLHCAHESRQQSLCSHIVQTNNSVISLSNEALNPADFTALGFVLRHLNDCHTNLNIKACHFGPEGLAALKSTVSSSELKLTSLT